MQPLSSASPLPPSLVSPTLLPARPVARGLKAIQGVIRAPIVDDRDPLTSPITVLVMLAKAAGFRWYGVEKSLPNGETGTSCYLNTVTLWSDGSQSRRVVWSFIGGDEAQVELGGDACTIWQFCAGLGYVPGGVWPKGVPPVPRGAGAVLAAVRAAVPWADGMPFNVRGRELLRAAAEAGHPEARRLIAGAVELYRGFVWKLTMPIDHPPHPDYGYPLDSHFRYRKGKRVGDVRQSLCRDARMEELRVLGLR